MYKGRFLLILFFSVDLFLVWGWDDFNFETGFKSKNILKRKKKLAKKSKKHISFLVRSRSSVQWNKNF